MNESRVVGFAASGSSKPGDAEGVGGSAMYWVIAEQERDDAARIAEVVRATVIANLVGIYQQHHL
jgi:hypothetical protein